MLLENEWMDESSKKAALEKVDKIEEKVAYPDYTFNNNYMNDL